MLKVALIRQRYAQDGGAERFVARAMEALKSHDIQLTLITREWTKGKDFDVLACNPFHIGRVWRDWSFARCVCRTVNERQFDLVQSHERIACCDVYRAGDGVHREWLACRARVLGWPGRLAMALNPYHYYVKRAEKKLFTSPRLKAVICNSKMVREEIRRHFGVPEEKLRVIYSGVAGDEYHPRLKLHRAAVRAQYGIPEDATLFLFVGSGFERKGVPALLAAMAQLPGDTFLLVVGRDRRMGRYQRRARRLGLAERVLFLGRQPDVKPYYGAADALVLPTLYDPFPNVILEAMASGLPVVTSPKSGAAELIEDGVNGYVCDAVDEVALAERMRRLAVPGARAVLGAAARRAVEPLTLERMGDQLLDCYRSLARPGAGASGPTHLNIVHTEASLGWGGQEIRILTEAEGMLRRGHRVTLLCPPEARIHAEARARGVPVTTLPIGRKNLRGLRALYRWLKAHPVDVINTHSSTDTWLAALGCALLKNPPPLVRTRHISSPIPDNAPTRWLYRRATRHIITTGEALRRQLIEQNGYPAGHISSIPTGIDTARFAPGDRLAARARLGLPPDAAVVGIVATLRSWKGHSYLLDAFARLDRDDVRLLIVGDGPGRPYIERQARELNIHDRVVMPGNQGDVLPWLQSMDIFVLPSYANEAVPQAVMQAMACGLPVISTNIGGIPEAVQHEVTGIMVEPKNIGALTAAMRRLLGDSGLRARLGAAARVVAESRFGLGPMLERMEVLFAGVHSARRPQAGRVFHDDTR